MNNNKLTRVVSKKTLAPTIPATHCSTTDCYGVILLNTKGFIVRDYFGNGDFRVRLLDQLTRGNCLANITSPTLADLLEALITRGADIFVFATPQELMIWLAED